MIIGTNRLVQVCAATLFRSKNSYFHFKPILRLGPLKEIEKKMLKFDIVLKTPL